MQYGSRDDTGARRLHGSAAALAIYWGTLKGGGNADPGNQYCTTLQVREVWWAYLLVLAGSAMLCAGLTTAQYWILHVGATSNLENRRHTLVSDLGSSVVVALCIALPLSSLIHPLAGVREKIFVLLAVLLILLCAEVFGSSYRMLPSWHIGAEISGAFIIWSTDMGIALVRSATVNLILTILWIVIIANAFKLLNRSIRITTGIISITCLTIFVITSTNNQIAISTLAIGLVGCISGFYIKTTRTGDYILGNGSVKVIGVFIAFLAIQIDESVSREESITNALTPILVCSFILFNLSLVVIYALLSRGHQMSPSIGGFSQQLLSLGLSSSAVRTWSYSIATTVGIVAYLIHRLSQTMRLILTGTLIAAYLAGGTMYIIAFYATKNLKDNSTTLRQKQSG
tara:strand:+ start:331 stop:1530 length:1200 start_codon:yes stop_codon:yes gene_type:complete